LDISRPCTRGAKATALASNARFSGLLNALLNPHHVARSSFVRSARRPNARMTNN